MSQRNRTDRLIATQWCDQVTFSEYYPVQLERTTRACIFGRALNAANEGQQCNIDSENKKVYFMGSVLSCNKVLGMLGTYRVREGVRLLHMVVVFSSIWYNTALYALIPSSNAVFPPIAHASRTPVLIIRHLLRYPSQLTRIRLQFLPTIPYS